LRREAAKLYAEKLIDAKLAKLREADERRFAHPGASPLVATPSERLDAWRSAPALEPGEGEQDERYDERTDCVLDGDVSGARLEPWEKRGKAARWNEPVHGGDDKKQDAKQSSAQRQGPVHRADVREDRSYASVKTREDPPFLAALPLSRRRRSSHPVDPLDGLAKRFGDPDHRPEPGGFGLTVQPQMQGRVAKARLPRDRLHAHPSSPSAVELMLQLLEHRLGVGHCRLSLGALGFSLSPA
jgi:hypothetical protein